MRKWLLVLAVVALVAVGGFLIVRESLATRRDWAAYSGTYVASADSSHAKRGDLLVLRANGTWQQRRAGDIVDGGGKATTLPGPRDLEKLNWLGPTGAARCAEGAEECPLPDFATDTGDPLLYVPVASRRTSNKGDFTTSGWFFRVLQDGAVLLDEEGVHWNRRDDG